MKYWGASAYALISESECFPVQPFMTFLFINWYFVDLPKKIYQIWMNFLWFFKGYFDLPELIRSFFAPWKGVAYTRRTIGFDIEEWFGNIVFNSFSTMIGMVLRTFVIIIGIIFEILAIIFGILFFLLWLIFPFALIVSLLKGITLI